MSGSDACSVFLHCGFGPFGIPCNFFLVARPDVLGKKNSCKYAFSNVAVRWE